MEALTDKKDVEELQDYLGPLDEFLAIVQELVKLYGPKAVISFDAGHNNVSVLIEKPRDTVSLKQMAKALHLPAGKDARLYDHRYVWRKRGGYIDWQKIYTAIEDLGFTHAREQGGMSPDGNNVSRGDTYLKAISGREGWTLTLSKHYGVTAQDNRFSITLTRGE